MSNSAPEDDEIRVLLDECVSPNIVSDLWSNNVNAIALRDRGKRRLSDANVMSYAQEERRAVVTINESDFHRIARVRETHHGVLSMPSGGSRMEQLEYIQAMADWARKQTIPMDAFRDKMVWVDDDLRIKAETVKALITPIGSLIPFTRRFQN